jgi:hypothetical protein
MRHVISSPAPLTHSIPFLVIPAGKNLVHLRLDAAVLEDPALLVVVAALILPVEAALEGLTEVQTGPLVLQVLLRDGTNLLGPIVPLVAREEAMAMALGVMESTLSASAT